MSQAERSLWIWPFGDAPCQCRPCFVKGEMEKVKYERERKYYAKAKEQMYPRPEKSETLRRINSRETWEGTQSFYQLWRLPSTLAHMLGPLIGERKGTGFVGDTSGATATGGDGGGDGDAGGPSQPSSSHHAAQLEQLDEELEAVEEESLRGDSEEGEGSVHSTRSSLHAVAVGA